ncbi:MAG: glutamate-1-semialdehyde 2,1-aminomutase [Candidatus Cloacimonetes bacterium]|nr:glutamate-1-semialdehyde 2,1-aminomutase [Candidatus Cloacimonadota bacterium]
MQFEKSKKSMQEARQVLVGGVNSPVRAFRNLNVPAPFIKRGEGAYLYDEDNNRYLDYVLSWGPLLLGHLDSDVVEAMKKQLSLGITFGAPTALETELALLVREFFPVMEKIRFVSSGTEAIMSAIRVARGFTSRNLIVKFDGCYHGHADSLLVKAGSGMLTHAHPDSAGVSEATASSTLVAEFNNLDSVRNLFLARKGEIACVLLEPVTGNMGVIAPEPGFLEGLRTLCDEHNSLLIFDEVMTGFRVTMGGACELYGVKPDMVCLGKIIGGGMPVGAYGGKKEIMSLVSPEGPVYQAGTLSGNPLGMACGLATLQKIRKMNPYGNICDFVTNLKDGLGELLKKKGIEYTINSVGGMFTLFFTKGPVRSKSSVDLHDKELFQKFFEGMLQEGIYLPCSQYEAVFVSVKHTSLELEMTLTAAKKVLQAI